MNVRSLIVSERFWSLVNVVERRRCWIWRGASDGLGYGQFRMNGKTIRAPRVAFFLRNGHWPNNALHRCDNPPCCNPDHIWDGTRFDNMRDMVRKGRNGNAIGEQHGRSVLTELKVIGIRQDYKSGLCSMVELSRKYKCSQSTIQRVVARTNWRHIP